MLSLDIAALVAFILLLAVALVLFYILPLYREVWEARNAARRAKEREIYSGLKFNANDEHYMVLSSIQNNTEFGQFDYKDSSKAIKTLADAITPGDTNLVSKMWKDRFLELIDAGLVGCTTTIPVKYWVTEKGCEWHSHYVASQGVQGAIMIPITKFHDSVVG